MTEAIDSTQQDTIKALEILDGIIPHTVTEWRRAIIHIIENTPWQGLQGYHSRRINRIIQEGLYKQWKKEIAEKDLWDKFNSRDRG